MGDFERVVEGRNNDWSFPRTDVGDMRCCRRRLTEDDATDDDDDNTDECETLSLLAMVLPRCNDPSMLVRDDGRMEAEEG